MWLTNFVAMYRKQLTKEQAYQKLRHYCGYQERSHQEVKDKAYSFGLRKTEVEELTSRLIEEDYLNEERFANLFAGGKFRMKGWGRIKIKYELKQKRVSEYCIKKALKEIPEEDYLQTLRKLAKKKWDATKGAGINRYVKMAKTRDYLIQKGFESGLIDNELKGLSD
jgi:regulatory protein